MTQWVQQDARFVKWEVDEGIHAIFTTRQGGVSAPPFHSLNLSFNVKDSSTAVTENRYRAMGILGRTVGELVMAEQIHGRGVGWAEIADASRGAFSANDALPEWDGLLTRHSDIVLGMGFADCVPIFLAVPTRHIVGILHAGWRGTIKGVQVNAMALLREQGIEPKEIRVGIGPSIGPCCYEVDDAVATQFSKKLGSQSVLVPSRDGHYLLDLWEANREQLVRAGVLETNIDISRLCTACHEDRFFSYRRDQGRCGRMGGFICMSR